MVLRHPAFLLDNQRMSSLSQKLKEKAAEIGFSGIGIVPAAALDAEGTHLQEWLDKGFHGSMAWLEREPEKRSDPRILFPGAKSVVVLILNYNTDHKHAEDTELGKISRYAWGDDYHDVMREKLNELFTWIKTEIPEADGKICVDTAPMMDKTWAVRAGLGWLGKHSNLITTHLGSWVFIGEIILNIELEYDTEIVADHCGTCTACIDACPTNAIVESYVVDSRKCISYATIELRDEILPNDIATNLEGWIYGCDICQDVCPWNRFEKPTNELRFEPRLGETSVNLSAIENLSHEDYIERFRKSAIKRTKLSGLQRNATALKTSIAEK